MQKVLHIVIIAALLTLIGCTDSTPKIVISKQDLYTRGIESFLWGGGAQGVVKNAGSVDVRNVIISYTCSDCIRIQEAILDTEAAIGEWIAMSAQGDKINYLAAGDKEEFKFIFARIYQDERPTSMPDVKIKVISFDVVE